MPRLWVPASAGRGGTTSLTTKLDLLHVVMQTLAEQAGLNLTVVQDESTGTPRLQVVITPTQDVSARVRFGPVGSGSGGVLGADWTYAEKAPSMTDVIVGGTKPIPANADGTEDSDADADMTSDVQLRQYRYVSDSSPESAAWVRRAEGFVDASNTTVPAELDQAGAAALADTTQRLEFSGTLFDNRAIKYGRDYLIGYRVGVDPLPGVALSDVVREVQTKVQVQQGQQTEQITAAIGWSLAAVAGTTTPQQQKLRYGLFRFAEKIKVWG